MGLLLAFAPFIAFAVIDRLVGSLAGLCAGAAVSLALLCRDFLTPSREPKLLELGTGFLFLILAIYAWLARSDWSVITVRLFVDSGLFTIVIVSILIGQPFTTQYAKEEVRRELWQSPEFKKINLIISGAWAVAFFFMIVAELALLFLPKMPHRLGVIAIVVALVGAFKFTGWYPNRFKDGMT